MNEVFKKKYYNAERQHEYYIKHREQRLAHQKAYDAAHREQKRQTARARYRRQCIERG